jgi:3-methyladenine DNA glycosylase AlkC
MKIVEHGCRINGLSVTEVTIKAMPNMTRSMEAVYALGEFAKKGEEGLFIGTHGRCTAYTHNWSKDTIKLLDELLDSMEEDLLPRHFKKEAGMEDNDEGVKSGEVEEANQI